MQKGRSDGSRILHSESMVMLGMYQDAADGKLWLLLQNIWNEGYFRVVSAEYFASYHGHMMLVYKDYDVSLKEDFLTTEGMFVETSAKMEEEASFPDLAEDYD